MTTKLRLRMRGGGFVEFNMAQVSAAPYAAVGADKCSECEHVHLIIAPRQLFKPLGGSEEAALFTDPRGILASVELTKAEAIALAERLLKSAGESVTVLKINAPPAPGTH